MDLPNCHCETSALSLNESDALFNGSNLFCSKQLAAFGTPILSRDKTGRKRSILSSELK